MENSFEKYRSFTVSQFALDDEFINWVKHPTSGDELFWTRFLNQYPQQSENLLLAKKLVLGLKSDTETAAEETKDRIWKAITLQSSQQAGVVKMKRRTWLIAAAAAMVIGITSIVFFRMNTGTERQVIETAYGEKRTITLPDNSMVILNAASKIEYEKQWNGTAPREVWIEGEAFLDIVHINKNGAAIKPSERFIVHLKSMDVEVLGTTFTVNTRRNGEQVVLQTGSIKVNLKDEKQEYYLKPGEMVQYTQEDKAVVKETTNAGDHALWKDNRLKFDNTSLQDVIQLIEDTYGYKVVLADSTLLDRTISGTLSSENENVLFKALETMLDVKISISAKTATISKK
ncbi:MAG TPA: FecR domain-containing protein [Chitinophagaceae bacterium]|nr:FecR domain-containing protein [Chitinophagaceae bacterium]